MVYAFAKDGGFPSTFAYLNKSDVPTLSGDIQLFNLLFTNYLVWLCVMLSTILGAVSLISEGALSAFSSISTIALYIAYGIPILLKNTTGKKIFQRGPIHLGNIVQRVDGHLLFGSRLYLLFLCFPRSIHCLYEI